MSESTKGRLLGKKLGKKKKPSPPQNDEGRMPLADHLRELRDRLFKSVLAILVTSVAGWFLYDWVIDLLTDPACNQENIQGVGAATKQCPSGWLIMQGVLTPLSFQLKLAFICGLVMAAPVWSYQVWAFVAPGLYSKEKKYGLGFVGAAVPLFLGGIALCYWMLPRALGMLLSFTPEAFASTLPADEYLDFVIRIFLVFGLAFELPVLLVALNFIGVLSAKKLMGWWRAAVLVIFVFAAVATPTGDPFTMAALALPMVLLYFMATGIAALNDKRRERNNPFRDLDDDEASSIDDDDDDDELGAAEDIDAVSASESGSVTASELDRPEPVPAQRSLEAGASADSAKRSRSGYADDDDIT